MTVSVNTLAAENSGTFFTKLGNSSTKAAKQMATIVLKDPEDFRD